MKTVAEVEAYEQGRRDGLAEGRPQPAYGRWPTVAIFVRGGVVQDIAIDAPVRAIVLDFDGDNDSPDEKPFVFKHSEPPMFVGDGEPERFDGFIQIGPTKHGGAFVSAAVRAIFDAGVEL